MIIKTISVIFISIIFCSCTEMLECNNIIENKIKYICVELDTVYTIQLNTLTDFNWNKLYIITGPRFPIEVEKIIGISYDKVIQDDQKIYLFIDDKTIIKELPSCRELNYFNMLNGNGFIEYLPNSTIKAKKYKFEGHIYYKIL